MRMVVKMMVKKVVRMMTTDGQTDIGDSRIAFATDYVTLIIIVVLLCVA